MTEIIIVRFWLTGGHIGESIACGALVTDDVHPQVESHKVLRGCKVDGGHLKFQKIINSNEIILWWWLAVREELLFHRDSTKVGKLTVINIGVGVIKGGHRLILELNSLFYLFSLESKVIEHIKVDLLLDVVDGEHLLVFIKRRTIRRGWEVRGGWDSRGRGA